MIIKMIINIIIGSMFFGNYVGLALVRYKLSKGNPGHGANWPENTCTGSLCLIIICSLRSCGLN